jgi:hypothetical protein
MPEVEWCNLIWDSYAIPRHAFFLWLAIQDSLSTGDGILKWGVNGVVNCFFCHSIIDCTDHLFFECKFSKRIWKAVLDKCSFLFFLG